MKKLLFICLMICSVSRSLFAQEDPEPALLGVLYDVVHVGDTNHRDKPFREDILLLIGAKSSKYVPYAGRAAAKRAAQLPVASGPVRAVSGKPLAMVDAYGVTRAEIFQHPAQQKMNITSTLGRNNYVLEYALPEIEWKIAADTRKIDAYTCQLATGEYAGRVYSAWFTTELPFPNGPWKLSGLPGLILEAEDSKKEVRFLFKEFMHDSAETTGSDRRRLIRLNENDYKRLEQAYLQDPVASMQAQLPQGAAAPEIGFRDNSGKTVIGPAAQQLIEENRKKMQTSFNNPIELRKP